MAKRQPEHAKAFMGKAKNIPAADVFMLPYQQRWIADKANFLFMEKSRRVGISYAMAYKTVRYHSAAAARCDTWISSRDEPTARLVIRDCKDFARILNCAAGEIGVRLLDREATYSLAFSGGTTITSVASNADVFAGKGGNVVLDEFALRADPGAVYAIAAPSITWGGSLAIISTHRGSANYFNQLAEEIKHKKNPKKFSHHRITLQDALDQGFLWKLQTKLPEDDDRLGMDEAAYFDFTRRSCRDEETFLQEYMCVPADDNSAFISYDLIGGCTLRHPDDLVIDTEETRDYTGRKGRIRTLSTGQSLAQISAIPAPLYLGWDVARKGDLSVLWLAARINGLLTPVKIVEMHSVEWERQEKELSEMLSLRNLVRCCIDATGIGNNLAERAQKRFGQYRVESVVFTSQVKESLAYPVRMGFEDRSLRVPSDEQVTSDLRAIKKEPTAAGNIRFSADRSANGHADRFWALALALHAVSKDETGAVVIASRPRQAALERDSITERFAPARTVRSLVESY